MALPRTSDDLAADRLMPGGVGAIWQIDARDVGVPHVWTGRVTGPQWSPGSAAVTVKLDGIEPELAREPVPATNPRSTSAGALVRDVVTSRTVLPRIEIGTIAEGSAAEMAVEGMSVADLLQILAADRGEHYYRTALPGCVAVVLDWLTSPVRRDLTDQVALVEGQTCEPDMALSTAPTTAELLGVASSLAAGREAIASSAAAPGGPVLGRKAALEAEITSVIAQQVLGTAAVELRPDLPTRAALELALRSRLQAVLAPVVAASCQITDTDLWHLQPGNLVLTRWPSEPTGLFASAVARIRTVTYSVCDPLGMTASLELWALEEST